MRDILQSRIALCIARSNWWIAHANTPANLARMVTDGHGRQLTKDELVNRAMEIADNHLCNAQEAFDQLNILQ